MRCSVLWRHEKRLKMQATTAATMQRWELWSNPVPFAPKSTALPPDLKEISYKSIRIWSLKLLWYMNGQAINLISLQYFSYSYILNLKTIVIHEWPGY